MKGTSNIDYCMGTSIVITKLREYRLSLQNEENINYEYGNINYP